MCSHAYCTCKYSLPVKQLSLHCLQAWPLLETQEAWSRVPALLQTSVCRRDLSILVWILNKAQYTKLIFTGLA